MLDEIIRSAGQLLDALVQREAGSWLIDVWVFLDPHDESQSARQQIVQLFEGEAKDLLYLSSTIGAYETGMDLAPLLRQMIGALHCSLYLQADADGVEYLKIAAVLESDQIDPTRLADRVREVAVFADRFEAALFGAEVDVR